MRSTFLIGALLALAVVSAGLATFLVRRLDAVPPASAAAAWIGGPFELTSDEGLRVTDRDLRGRHSLVFFGYTFCPDICPLGLQTIAQALDQLPAVVADQVVPLFITIDPERDTVPVLHDYVELFDPRIVGLTGSTAEVARALAAYRVYARKADPVAGSIKGPGYLMDHSTFTYLMDGQGRYITHFSPGITADAMAARIKASVAPAA